jgi:hypothetical protein
VKAGWTKPRPFFCTFCSIIKILLWHAKFNLQCATVPRRKMEASVTMMW